MTEERCACGHLREHHADTEAGLGEGRCGFCRLCRDGCAGYRTSLRFAGDRETVTVTREEVFRAAYRELARLGHAERIRVSIAIAKAIAGPDRG